MENQRLFQYATLGFVILLLWQAWQADYGPKPQSKVDNVQNIQLATPGPAGTKPESVPGDLPVASSSQQSQPVLSSTDSRPLLAKPVHIITDNFDVLIQPEGGTLVGAKLRKYPISLDKPDEGFPLLNPDGVHFSVAQSGLQSVAGSKSPNHHDIFTAEKTTFQLEDSQQELRVPLVWEGDDGLKVTKTFIFHRDSYLIDVEYNVVNNSNQAWQGRQYRQLQRVKEERGSMFMAASYLGGVIFSEAESYEKIDFDDMAEADLKRDVTGGWIAMIQHYFLSAWIPTPEEDSVFYSKKLPSSNLYILGMFSKPETVEAQQSGKLATQLYIGPKIQKDLEVVTKGLDLTVDFGLLTVIAQPLFIVLDFIHGWLGNWGFSIMILTLLIKLIFYKLSETSYRSMARMRKLQPKLQALKERHGGDRQKMGAATMELYKKEKVNPMGGCFPILIQIPVFISLYWVLLESVELRQAPFMLWIHDLSAQDPYYVLPVIMGITMFIQQRLNPAPLDPIQAKVFMILPVAFSFFFAFFPSGLVLYWVVNNTLSISQQYYITRHVLAEK